MFYMSLFLYEKNQFISHFFFFPRKAADQGHPHASYNLAIGHMKGYKTGLKPG